MTLAVRPLTLADWDGAKILYSYLTLGPTSFDKVRFSEVLSHPGTSVHGAFDRETLVGMATLHILPNVTWTGRPYALVENVVTHPDHQRQGVGRAVLAALERAAWAADAYKIMLLTGQKRGARGFYEACGFTSEDKHAMVLRRASARPGT